MHETTLTAVLKEMTDVTQAELQIWTQSSSYTLSLNLC